MAGEPRTQGIWNDAVGWPSNDASKGWICPKCGRVYSPLTYSCWSCNQNIPHQPSQSATDKALESAREILQSIK